VPGEATYLAWIDCRGTGLPDPQAACEAAGLGTSDGRDFGKFRDGSGFRCHEAMKRFLMGGEIHSRPQFFFRMTELITLLMEAKEEKQLLRFRKQLKHLDLLILDELGYVPTGKVGAELLFDVLSTAYERQSLVVTTNLPFEQWTEVLGSERLTHRCHILEAKGESFRLRDARRRQRRASGSS